MSVDVPVAVRAHGAPLGQARIRVTPEDFVVREWLGFDADRDGEHLLLTVRKRSANTMWVAKQLARLADIAPRDVGFAGLKDRHAVTEQAFTLPARSKIGDAWMGVVGEGFEVIAAARHRRKIKRGTHRANDFSIVLRDFHCEPQALAARLDLIRKLGVPNYFGPQRFGNDGGNLRVAERWFVDGQPPHDRFERGFALSAARSAVFNEILTTRVRDATWNRLLAGDTANLNGTGSIFAVAEVDESLLDRCARLDVHPTGPLWGRGELRTGGTVRELESAVAARYAAWCAGMERADLNQERRPLRLAVENLTSSVVDGGIKLEFRLGRGAFATTVLHEIVDAVDGEGEEAE